MPLMALVDIETSAAEDMEKKPGGTLMSGTAAPSEGASTNIYQCLSNKGDTRALGKSDLLGGPIIDALLDMPEGTDKILRQVELEERARDLESRPRLTGC